MAESAQKEIVAKSLLLLAALLGAGLFWPALSAQERTPNASIPLLASAQFGWLADTEFLPPASGPGPVTFDNAHPYVRNNTSGQPTFRIADTTNPILRPWVAERMNKDNQEVLAGKFAFTARSSCWPAGVPGFLVFGCGARTVYFLQTLKEVVMINDGDQQVRHIYMNVPHSRRVTPSWYGESVGHYEAGDVLAVDTVGLNDRTFIDNYRTPHTQRLHVVERWKLLDGGKTLDVDIRVEDPGAFTTPWSARQIYHRTDQGPLTEMVCAENNGNFFHRDIVPIPTAAKPDF
jgi:hypothetical protein